MYTAWFSGRTESVVIVDHIRTLDVLACFSLWDEGQHFLQASQTILDSKEQT